MPPTLPNSASEMDFATFVTKYKKPVLTGVTVVVIAGAAGWFWVASQNIKENRAEQAYANAERSFYAGNPQLAESDLNRMVQRYSGTNAGVRATILLAKTYYELGKPEFGIGKLREALRSGASKPFRPALHALIAAGFENQQKFDSAAAEFAQAASAATSKADQESYQAAQARALESGRNKPAALKIWQAIAARENSPLAPEARIRIGELTATPAKGGD